MPTLPFGCQEWTEERGYEILRIHYSSDPLKTPEWAEKRRKQAPSDAMFRQEFEIDHYAGAGALMFPEYRENAGIIDCEPFPIPHTWTRYFALDPHKRRPHAMLWMAVDPNGDHWCSVPETRVLNADLEYVSAGDVQIGDWLVGFDERKNSTFDRRWQRSIVEDVEFLKLPCVRLILSDGTELTCSTDHMWLSCGPSGDVRWRRSLDLKQTHEILRLANVWKRETSWEAGYLAAAFDGEGSLCNDDNPILNFAQKDNSMLAEVERLLFQYDFRYGKYDGRESGVNTISVTRKNDMLRFLGAFRPKRLLAGFNIEEFGAAKAFAHPLVVNVEPAGTQEVVAIQTSSRTFIAEGLASHNCYREYWPSRIYGRKGNTPEDDRLYKVDDYVASIKYLEGPDIGHFAPGGFADNDGKREKIRLRIMDPHGKAIFTTTVAGKDEPETFWDRYTELGIRCTEAKKDIDSGRDTVGKRMRPRKVMYADGEETESLIHIFTTLPELRLELRTNRWPALTPAQAEVRDPHEKPLEKRKHLTDLLRYLEMEDPQWIDPEFVPVSVKPLAEGISY